MVSCQLVNYDMPINFILLLFALLPRVEVSAHMTLLLVIATTLVYIVRMLVLTVSFIGLPTWIITFLD